MRSVAELANKAPRTKRVRMTSNWPLPECFMGIELEAESDNGRAVLPANRLTYWESHSDGSLQNGIEYVLRTPLYGDELAGAIHEIMEQGKYTRTMTGSTHIHMDMLSEQDTHEVLSTLVLMVFVLESMLYAAGDASRQWCGYANSLRSGPNELLSTVLDDNVSTRAFVNTYSRSSSPFGRYYGLNLAALVDYGSLEFRYFPTATSQDELVRWVALVQSFKKAAYAVGNRQNLHEIMEDEERFRAFLNEHFADYTDLFGSLGEYHVVRHNYRKALAVAHTKDLPAYRFDGYRVFADGKFSKIIRKPPSQAVDIYPIRALGLHDTVPSPSAGDDSMFILIYNGNVYINSGMIEPAAQESGQDWLPITEYISSTWVDYSRIYRTLETVLDEYGQHLSVRTRNYINEVLSGEV